MRTPVSKLTRLGLIFLAVPALILQPTAWKWHRDNARRREEIDRVSRTLRSLRAGSEALAERKRWLEAEIAALNAARDPAEEKRFAAERRKQAVVKVLASLKAKAKETGAAEASPPPQPFGPQGNVYFAELLGNPVYAAHFSTYTRQHIEERYASMWAGLSLSPADLSRLKALLVEKEISREDVMGIFANRALVEAKDVDGVDVYKAQLAVTRELDEKIKDTFGTGVREKLRAFEGGTGARQNILDALTARLSYSEAPLTDAQTAQLIEAYNASAFLNPRMNFSELPEPFVTAAQSILKAEQMVRFRKLAAEMPQAR